MRIALNTSILRAPRTGIGQYVTELVHALAADSELELCLFNGWGRWKVLPDATLPGYSTWTPWIKRLVPGAYPLRRWLEQQRFHHMCGQVAADLYHDPSLWPLHFDGPMVMTLHDLTHVHFPHTQPADRLREIERHVARGVESAARILVDSHFIAQEAMRYYGIPAGRLKVAPLGCAERFHPRSVDELAPRLHELGLLPGRYLLCVGTLEPRKNLPFALRAYARLPASVRARYPLVLAGMPGWGDEQLAAPVRQMLASGQVRLLGYQEAETLAELLSGARLLLFPSLYEGFGLPVLEAMASGTPVVLSRSSALPEVAGQAGLQIDPDDEQACADAMLQLIEDDALWQQQQAAGLLRAGDYSWGRCAQITAATYREAVRI